ncbi:MAG TPA: TonB-dependent receptor [bacterium]|nr:TonB-dependent receptor [bacterium]HPN45644.1 TonB-dependent receptor [bacterium]
MKTRFLIHSLIVVTVLVLLFSYSIVLAGTTGKISGLVTDVETKEPLPGVNIVIEGTSMGAATDVEGNYNILNIPPGTYKLRVSMIGYQTQIVEKVRVSIDLTTSINASLQQTVLEAGQEVTVVAERPLVRTDMTSSLSSVSSDEITSLPVQEVRDVLELQAGIVKSGNDFHIRGGRTGEVAYWVDGVATTDVFGGGMGVTVENSAIEELQVISGTFNAEYGQAMSGIINIITKEGGVRYTGQVKAYAGDYLSNDEKFDVLEKVIPVTDKDGKTQATSTQESPLTQFNPIYNGEFSLSGPVPLFGDDFTFFVNGRYFQNEGYLYGRDWFTPQGLPGDSALVPMNPHKRYSAQAKFTYKLSNSIKLNYNVFLNAYKNDRSYAQNYKYNPYGTSQQIGGGYTHIFSMNHVLSPTTFYELKVNRFYTESKNYVYEDYNKMPDYLVSVYADAANSLPADTLDLSNPAEAALFEQYKSARRSFDYIIDPANPEGYIHPDSASTGSYSFLNDGMSMNYGTRHTAYWVGKLDFTSQVTNVHQAKFGAEFRTYELFLDNFTIRPKTDANSGEQIVPFVPDRPDISSVYRDYYTRKPREFSAYIQDKIELKEIILNLGLRFDYFDANSVQPVDPSDPNIYAPFRNENKYKNWVEPPDGLNANEMAEYIAGFTEYTPDERRAFMHEKVDAKMAISPRLGIAYPITDRGVIHFSYGHFFQIPEFQYLYSNADFKLSQGGGYTTFGNANLEPQKTVMYEIGLQQQITRDLGVDVTLFYRDVRDWVGTSPLIDTPNPGIKYSNYENKDYENVRGVTLKVDKRYSYNFSARLDYTFQVVEGTYSNPNDAYNAAQSQNEPRLSLIPLNWDQRHTANGSLIYRLQSWTFSMIGRYWTGRPYTPSFPVGQIVGGATLVGLKENSSRLPSQKSVDFLINKHFSFSDMQVDFFINVYNIFDNRDETAVYGDTGTAEYTTNIRPSRVVYDPARIGTTEEFVKQASWYTAPREVQIGFMLGF